MKFFYFFKKEKLRSWIEKHAEGPQAAVALSVVSFFESIFFPIPPDILLITIISVRKVGRWFYYSTLTVVSSILGAGVGYLIGALFFETIGMSIISFYGLEADFQKIASLFQKQTFWAMFIGAVTPIPFKIFTLAGGVFGVNFLLFILASLVGRSVRFYPVGFVTKIYGPRLVDVFFKYFNIISLAIVLLVALLFIFVL